VFLARVLEEKRRALRMRAPVEDELPPGPPTRDFAAALRGPTIRVIAEVKRASPSAGAIRPGADPAEIAAGYERAGAAAVSVLTEEKWFDGSLAHLAAARARVGIPVLRKDFIVDEIQLREARSVGADAALLIARALSDDELRALVGACAAIGLAALVEVHDADEARRAIDAGATIVGVNHRNLSTLEIDLSIFAKIRATLPAGTIAVAESGIKTAADVRRLRGEGADAILVGETLMRAPDPGAALAELLS
jgi:indole-3-glycerol phosphate synthase